MTSRPPLIFRNWHKQPWFAAHGSQTWVVGRPSNVALLVGKDTFFRTSGYAPNYDYPNPTLPKSRLVAVNTQCDQGAPRSLNLLIKQDRIWGGVGQVIGYDWQNPVRPKDSRVAVHSGETGPDVGRAWSGH
jgi:hypothetical protein